jgi:uncharacterized membrane protein YdjX (TVP38/TMEM64 family)
LLAEAVPRGGWRTVALVRLVPLIPFKLSNYVFGWSRVPLRDFVLGTLVGVVPYSLANAYLGSAAAGRTLGELSAARSGTPASPAQWGISAAVALVASAAAVAVARRALSVLSAAGSEERAGTDDDASAPEHARPEDPATTSSKAPDGHP